MVGVGVVVVVEVEVEVEVVVGVGVEVGVGVGVGVAMSKAMFAVGVFVALATSYFQAMMTHDIVRSNAEAVRECRELSRELQEVKETSWKERIKPL